jgi:hypothetical protein
MQVLHLLYSWKEKGAREEGQGSAGKLLTVDLTMFSVTQAI